MLSALAAFLIDVFLWCKDTDSILKLLSWLPSHVKASTPILSRLISYFGGGEGNAITDAVTSTLEESFKFSVERGVYGHDMMRLRAFYMLERKHDAKSLSELFQELLSGGGSDTFVLSGSAITLAALDIDKSLEFLEQLKTVTETPSLPSSNEDLEQVWTLASNLSSNRRNMHLRKKPRGKRVMRHPPKNLDKMQRGKPKQDRWVPMKLRTSKKQKQQAKHQDSVKQSTTGGKAGGGGSKKNKKSGAKGKGRR